MRQLRVVTNETCGLSCRFCNARREHERASIAAGAAVRARLDRCLREPATDELVLTGGEPGRRQDLATIVDYARARTSARLVLETNAAELQPGAAEVLAAAGLDAVRVHVPAWGDELDVFCRREGTGDAVRRTVTELLAAGLQLEASTPVVADNVRHVAALPGRLTADDVHPTLWWLRLPWQAPDASALAAPATAVAAAEHWARAAREHGIAAQLDPSVYVPPCVFGRPGRVAHLYALNPGAARREGYGHDAVCDGCSIRSQCPGVPRGFPAWPRAAVAGDRLRRRLTVISTVAQQVQRELVTHETYRSADGSTRPAAIVRVNFRCNQACQFCFVSTHLPAASRADVEAAIDDIGARRGIVALSGGEPTLNANLPDYVRRAKAAGAIEVELQTNAVALDEPGRAALLADAGVDVAFVSLHGASAAVSDAVTDAPGTHARTLLGVDALRDAGVRVRLNFVLCGPNHHEFPAFVQLVAQRWPGTAINCSFVAPSTDLVPRTRELIPRYADVLPSLAAGVREARRREVEVGGFESMCGIPLCLVPNDLAPFFALAEVPPGDGGGEFLKPAACRQCVLETRCFGIRRGYAELYGTAELQPVQSRS